MAKFTRVADVDFGSTIAQDLVPVADELRDLKTQFGLRPYEVRVVRVGWTGGARGRGDEYVVSSTVILPTPRVNDLTSLDQMVQPIGTDEFGSVRISEISGSFTEDQLLARGADGSPPPADQSVFWEIEYAPTPQQAHEKRRFTVKKAPWYDAGRLQWVVDLERQREDRARSGRIRP